MMRQDTDIKKKLHRSVFLKPVNLFICFVMTISLFFVFSVGAPYVFKQRPAHAVVVGPSFCPIPFGAGCGCAFFGQGYTVQQAIDYALSQVQNKVIEYVQGYIRAMITDKIGNILTAINDILEMGTKDFWTEMWETEMRPGFQAMTSQLHVCRTDQSRMIGSFFDSQNLTYVQGETAKEEVEASRNARPSELVCMAATQAGGFSRANSFSRSMRFGMEDEKNNTGTNAAGTLWANGKDAIHGSRWNNYMTLFCNNQSNKGVICAASGTRMDADIKPTGTLLNPLTIDMKNNPDRIAAEAAIDNIAGIDVINPIRPAAARTSGGQKLILDRREILAKRAAARSVNMLTTMGWRTRGSNMNTWVDQFNQKSGSKITVSADPSYYEVMHALTKYKFLSGQYGAEQIQEPLSIEREKLISSSLYLMQLRDYFELLERVALAAAVDTAISLDSYVEEGSALADESRR